MKSRSRHLDVTAGRERQLRSGLFASEMTSTSDPAYGRGSAWFRGVQRLHEGRIRAGGIQKDVSFLDPDLRLTDEIDAAYRTKYRRHGAQYVNMMVSPEARSATLRLLPR